LRRIAFINEKGGTCKTTLAVNTAAYFAREKGARVLLIDLDTQGHAGKSIGVDVRSLEPNAFHWLTDSSVRADQVIRGTAVSGLSIIPSYKQMSEFPVVVAADPRREHRLAARLAESAVQGFDVVIFDSPPSMGLTTFNILVAATEIVVPVALTYLSLDGCSEVAQTVRSVAERHGRPELRISRVVPTLYRKTALADEILAKLEAYFPGATTQPLGFNVKVDESQSHGQTIWEYAPWSRDAQMLQAIAEEVWSAGAAASAPALQLLQLAL
jgi:chromosome partitioning protein